MRSTGAADEAGLDVIIFEGYRVTDSRAIVDFVVYIDFAAMSLLQTVPLAETLIVETIPSAVVRSSVQNFRRLHIGTVVAFCCLLTILVAQDAEIGWMSALAGGICLLLPCALFAIGLSAVMRHELSIRIPTVKLVRDELTVHYGKRVLIANVKDCRIRRGRACTMRLPGCPRLRCCRSVLLIDFPRAGLWGRRVRVAAGYTDDTLKAWERELSVAYQINMRRDIDTTK